MSSIQGEFETIDGGCQCSLVRYRVILPKDGKKVFFDGKEYPYANHCTCRTCRRSYSSVTHTVLNIPSSYIQFASRVPYPQHGTAQEPSASSSHTSDATLPPSCAVSSIGNLRSGNVRRLSTTSTISTVSATSTSSLTTAFTLSSRTSIATAASGSSSVSSSNSAPPLTRRVSFVEVDTPLGCCSATSMEPSPAIAPPPLLPEMLITPPRPAYYSPLAAEARRNPNSTTRYSGSGTSSIPRPSGVTTRMANASQVGGGVENSFRQSCNNAEELVFALAAGSLDQPEDILEREGIFDKSIKWCELQNGDEGELKLLRDWSLRLPEL